MKFKDRVRVVLEKDNIFVFGIDEHEHAPFDFFTINPMGVVSGVKCQAHGHLNRIEKLELLKYNIPIFIGSEKYDPMSERRIKIVRLKKGV